MELLVVGCSGSLAGVYSPASGYVLRENPRGAGGGDSQPLLLDIGPGVLGALQSYPEVQISDCHLLLSHLHADHCLDFPSLLVWRRFHPTESAQERHKLLAPSITARQLGTAGADHPDAPDDFSDTFEVLAHDAGPSSFFDATTYPSTSIGTFNVYSAPAVHATEAYITRIHGADGSSVVYSGDTALTPRLAQIAHGADVLLCEATWGETSEGKPDGMHMSGEDAGLAAAQAGVKHLVLTHIPPWGDGEGALRGARRYFDGELTLARPGMRIEV
ncbi:MBL fold metallo-hydrolase [Corynebacterium heidelbergense]|uniref:Metallo-beta-lactamase domain-containing protein n=1 Tax=Corynebacterium heidelbergense TaxID=2055947 RepID=A0A364V7Q5_9CORY|nr:MBL fold metallo-hydrolase [Corynebacterium heidelbergense]RAV32675.1 hypothetical protein DLJ54_02255 [Corynebacterium heidelbergense]